MGNTYLRDSAVSECAPRRIPIFIVSGSIEWFLLREEELVLLDRSRTLNMRSFPFFSFSFASPEIINCTLQHLPTALLLSNPPHGF
jgi:hypothetical protein